MEFSGLNYSKMGSERIVFLKNGNRVNYRYEFYYHECDNKFMIKSIRKHYKKYKNVLSGYIELIYKTVKFYSKKYEKFESD